MKFAVSNQLTGFLCLVSSAIIMAIACGNPGEPIYVPTIIEGKQFALSINFPSAFYEPATSEDTRPGPLSFVMGRNDQLWFRISANSADELLVTATDIGRQRFSNNSFAVDTAHSYSVRPTTLNDWNQGAPIGDLKAVAQAGGDVKDVQTGYEYRGHTYKIRGDLTEGKWFASTNDGALVVVAGGVRPSENSKYMLDIYDGALGRRLAAADVSYKGPLPLAYALLHAHLINRRWVAISLDAEFKEVLLFDFKTAPVNKPQ